MQCFSTQNSYQRARHGITVSVSHFDTLVPRQERTRPIGHDNCCAGCSQMKEPKWLVQSMFLALADVRAEVGAPAGLQDFPTVWVWKGSLGLKGPSTWRWAETQRQRDTEECQNDSRPNILYETARQNGTIWMKNGKSKTSGRGQRSGGGFPRFSESRKEPATAFHNHLQIWA